jgi:drug/metabolite transporter (DMT)-like permease
MTFLKKETIAILTAFGAAVFYSLNQIFNKKIVLFVGTLPALVLVYFTLTVFDFFLCSFFGDFFIPSVPILLEIIFLSLVGALAILTLFESFKYLPIGIALTLANLSPVFLTLLVFIFTEKLPSLGKLFLIFLILFALYLIISPGKERKENIPVKAFLLPLFTALGWAIFGWEIFRFLNTYHLNIFAISFYLSLYMFVIFLAAFLAVFREKRKLIEFIKVNKRILVWTFWSGFFTTGGFILSIVPFQWVPPEDTPVIEAIFTFTTPLGAIFSYLFMGERLNRKQIMGIALAFLSLLAFFFV